ncbi:GIY-YIG nuclease family protein [Mesorhizobium huakuii]|uniref:GIY-YIG nuclease family protein n=1 Tax=Mesorhizobium huakuii TaxID=28104 RepID=A0ABZ0VQQ7_9HYPH|nr:hypothetical protein [Mesorhizobium huakuii]WQB99318.1 hypothetical protein U0R22_003494 [Mesorhizobium huakuii]
MTDYVDWPGSKGTYRYWFLTTPGVASSIKREGGNYMFAKLTDKGYVPVYIGIADDLSARISSHDRWDDAVAAGATHVLSHTHPNVAMRQAEEIDLIAYWQPVLNTQHRQQQPSRGGLGS